MIKKSAATDWIRSVAFLCIFGLLLTSLTACQKDQADGSLDTPAQSEQSEKAGEETEDTASGAAAAPDQTAATPAAAADSGDAAAADTPSDAAADSAGTDESTTEDASEESDPEVYGNGFFGGNPYEGGGLAKISEEQEAAIRAYMETMSLEEKVGQMFFIRFPGVKGDPYTPALAIEAVETYHVGGFVLFKDDFHVKSDTDVIDKLDAVQQSSKIPLLMAVDEEGGYVNRVSPYFRDTEFLAPRNAYAWGGEGVLMSEIYERCELLGDLHLNMNLYPVCDLSDELTDYIYYRAFSGDPDTAADYIAMVVRLMHSYQMLCSLKHFPGYGNNVDTHTGIAVDEREKENFYQRDLKPFMAGIAQGAETVMVSHNIVNCFDPEYPASISPKVHRVLREDLGFEGVILTDDLGMDALQAYSAEDVAVQAILAGNDMLITSAYPDQYDAVLAAVTDGRISEERIDESVYRILRMKLSVGLWE